MVRRPCALNGLERRGGGGGQGWRVRCERPVTEIIDRRQPAVMRAGVAGPASPGERAPSCGRGPGAPPRRKASHRDRRQRADALSHVSLPNTEFRSGTTTPASPGDAERDHLLRPLQEAQGVPGGPAGRRRTPRPATPHAAGPGEAAGHRSGALMPTFWHPPRYWQPRFGISLTKPQPGRGVTVQRAAPDRRVPGLAGVWHRAC
jgi:hypothetical protein